MSLFVLPLVVLGTAAMTYEKLTKLNVAAVSMAVGMTAIETGTGI